MVFLGDTRRRAFVSRVASLQSERFQCGGSFFLYLLPESDSVGMASMLKSIVIVYIIILILIMRQTTARPSGEWASSAHGCNNGDTKKVEICQRCAKQTKSPIVYPMCCNEEDEVHFWCYRYTTYGKMA